MSHRCVIAVSSQQLGNHSCFEDVILQKSLLMSMKRLTYPVPEQCPAPRSDDKHASHIDRHPAGEPYRQTFERNVKHTNLQHQSTITSFKIFLRAPQGVHCTEMSAFENSDAHIHTGAPDKYSHLEVYLGTTSAMSSCIQIILQNDHLVFPRVWPHKEHG
jgi:hypothetical protein